MGLKRFRRNRFMSESDFRSIGSSMPTSMPTSMPMSTDATLALDADKQNTSSELLTQSRFSERSTRKKEKERLKWKLKEASMSLTIRNMT